jgi:SCA7, zinc-binding domain
MCVTLPANMIPLPGPVDVERRCGVIKAEGVPCARSLACTIHSMLAKRAVPGRSLPYDMLLAAYHKNNEAFRQKIFGRVSPPASDPVVAVKAANPHPITVEELKAVLPPTGISIGAMLRHFPGRISDREDRDRFIKMVKENTSFSPEDKLLRPKFLARVMEESKGGV